MQNNSRPCRLSCSEIQQSVDHHVECITLREDCGAEQLLLKQQQPARAPLLSRLPHLRRLTFQPSGRPGPASEQLLLGLVRACLEATRGGFSELKYDLLNVVTASTRSSQMPRLSHEALHALVQVSAA